MLIILQQEELKRYYGAINIQRSLSSVHAKQQLGGENLPRFEVQHSRMPRRADTLPSEQSRRDDRTPCFLSREESDSEGSESFSQVLQRLQGAYLHAEADVERALGKVGWKISNSPREDSLPPSSTFPGSSKLFPLMNKNYAVNAIAADKIFITLPAFRRWFLQACPSSEPVLNKCWTVSFRLTNDTKKENTVAGKTTTYSCKMKDPLIGNIFKGENTLLLALDDDIAGLNS
ncbi:hypothetical protein HID58_078160 [Brassica napus]|uniref:Uncharacterized protein n=1 Tax=Brassica napus TaxID=3708 RepID=A0ABQ7YTM7_BRANA|nr:hypothetical protein HID58_078160 [Brassica napus]